MKRGGKNTSEREVERKESEREKEKKKRFKGHFHLRAHHLNKLQRSAIKELKLPNCWVTTATRSLIKAVSSKAVDRKMKGGNRGGGAKGMGELRRRGKLRSKHRFRF